MFITIVIKTCFGSLVMSSSKNKVFFVLQKDCVTASNARTIRITRNVHLHPCHFTYDTHFNKIESFNPKSTSKRDKFSESF